MRRIAHIFLFFVLISFDLQSQELLPFVENFTKTDYNGDNQVWSVCQGKDNAMYFANNHNLLRYNGVKWERYTLPNKTIIRSVFSDGDRIYCGSYNEFGFWKRNEGKMRYTSLSKNKNFFIGASNNEEIWKIVKFDGNIYFQSFNELYIYKENTIQKIRIPFQISYCFVVNNELLVASVTDGVYKFKDKKFIKILGWNQLQNTIIHSIDTHNQSTYIFTKKNGVYIEKEGKLSEWNHPLNAILKSELIITARFLNQNRLAIGTAFKGLYVINLKDNSFVSINRNNSLKNNSVLSIGFDKENDLWLGMDNGIGHVEINSPYSVFSDNTGVLGSVYAIATTEKGYLLGSNHGLFKYENNRLTFVENSQGQVWDINKIGDQYIIGHNDGTFTYDLTSFKKINTISGGWQLLKSDYNNVYYMAHYAGIIAYQNTTFSDFTTIKGLTKPIKNVAQNKPNELWAADNYKSLYKIKFKPNFEVESIENSTKINGISNDYEVRMLNYKNEILFYINNSWYHFNPISNKLEPNKVFNSLFKDITQIIAISNDRFVILKDGLLSIVTQKDSKFITELIPEKYYKGKIVNQDTKVYEWKNKLIINLDDGFFVYEPNAAKFEAQPIMIEGFYKENLIGNSTDVEYNQPVNLNVISPFFGFNKLSMYYQLNASEQLVPIVNGTILLNNLESGNQDFKVFYNDGNQFKQIASYNFSVSRPWYFSFWMILLYVLLTSGTFFLYYRWNKIRYIEKIKLKEEELKHQKEILQLELNAENKLKIQEYEKHILEIQVQTKASEVAGKSLSIAKQTEMIESIQQLLEKENDVSSLKNNIRKTIKLNSINKKEWETFENNLFKSHEDFITRLSTKYPALTSKDKKLSIYLKMNLTSKEIAPLMNISYRGVELHRYRLRKKLQIDQESNLSSFMNNV
ncbi:MAG: histidine kinase [Flavobacteriales bacterium]|nr:histidine kinase [Flavobacteriales bacterium]